MKDRPPSVGSTQWQYSLHSDVPRALVWLCANPVCKVILSVSTEKPDGLIQVREAA